jgi:site-specific recombinase XerD
VPALIADAGDAAGWRYVEFFTANIRNPNTRRAYARACDRFFAWCDDRGLTLTTIRPHDVATYIETLQQTHAPPGVKQQLAAVRMLFDWLITGQIVPANPASAVRGPKHVVNTGKTPVLEGPEWRRLIDAIPTDTVRDLLDRALIATLTYGFARVGAALKMRVEDLESKGSGWLIRLHEKGGKQHMMPCHPALAEALHAYIAAAGIAADKKAFLFRTSRGHGGIALADQPMTQVDAWRMVRKRALAAGIMAPIGKRANSTGIHRYRSVDSPNGIIRGGSFPTLDVVLIDGRPCGCTGSNRRVRIDGAASAVAERPWLALGGGLIAVLALPGRQ